MAEEQKNSDVSRRDFVKDGLRGAAILSLGGICGALLAKQGSGELMDDHATVWQLDPWKCTECGKCATHCVIEPSAVKAVHSAATCGHCDLCTGYFEPDPINLDEGAENHICPTNAITRTFIEEPYYAYTIEEDNCIGCAKCVDGCESFGNGAMHLQIRHDLCIQCDSCSIAIACPTDAFMKVPASQPYMFKAEDNWLDLSGKREKEIFDMQKEMKEVETERNAKFYE